MPYKPNDPYYAEFCTQRFDTGAATNADATPTATANRNGADDAGFVLTVANIDAGRYKVSGTIPNGYAAGDVVSISVAATVNSVAGKAVVDSFVLDSKRVGDLQDPSTAAVAAAVMGDVTDTVGADVVAIKVQTDKLTFTGSNVNVNAQVNSDKTGYSLTAGEHTQISTDAQTGLTAQGYTGARAATLDHLNADITSRSAPATPQTIDQTTLLPATPVAGSIGEALKQADKLLFDGAGNVKSTPQTSVTVGTNSDKTGYVLAAAGLDAISVVDPGAPANATTLPRMIVALWRRFFKKSTLTATQLATYADDGTTVNSTQPVSDDGTTQMQGAAS